MADENEIDPTLSDESTPLDPRGEDLAAEDLPLSGLSRVGREEDVEETDAAATGTDDDELVEDPDELAEAEADARAAASTEPVAASRRPKRKNAASTRPLVDAADDGDASDSLIKTTGSARPKKRTTEVTKKDHATPKRSTQTAAAPRKRTTPAQFARESWGELRKVVWPNGSQLSQYFVVVLVFVLFIIAFVMALDFAFGSLLMHFLGGA